MIVRPVTAIERELVREFYLALSEQDRWMRFCTLASDGVINRYVDRLRFEQTTILAVHDDDAETIALAELTPVGSAGELAFLVREDMRRRGIGGRLMARLLSRARMEGLRAVYVMFLSENTPMCRLAVQAAMTITRESTESRGWKALEPPTAADLVRFCVEDAVAHGEHFGTLMMARYGAFMNNNVKATLLPLETLLRNAASWPAAAGYSRRTSVSATGVNWPARAARLPLSCRRQAGQRSVAAFEAQTSRARRVSLTLPKTLVG